METSVLTAISEEHSFPAALIVAVFSEPWTADRHLAALRGWLMREHAEAHHPKAVDSIEALALETMATALHSAWLFGYRFRVTAAVGGTADGVGHEGSGGR